MTRVRIKYSTLSLAIALATAAPAAIAQQAAPGVKATELDAIQVTARRRTESIQDVPVAVSAFSEEQLRDLQATSIDGLQGAVPNMNIVQGRGSSNSVNVFIRGIGQPDALQTFDPGVGMYVDDVYYSRINGALFSLFDVGQVEVLRGPQGTLYGRNSTGGAIKLNTKNPFDNPGGAVELMVGEFGRRDLRAYIGHQAGENVAFSVAAASQKMDGYVKDPDTGMEYNGEDTRAFRGKLAFRPSESLSVTLSADWTRQDNALTLGQPTAPLYATDLMLGPVLLLPAPTGKYDFRSRTSFAPDQGQEMTHRGVSAHVDWDISNAWTFKSITAWRALETSSFIDIDASEFELGDVLVALDQEQFSQEFQFQYDNGSNVQAVFGLYYLREDVPSYQEAYADDFLLLGGFPLTFLRTIDDDLSNTTYAAFAHVSWAFAPTWNLSAGLRWSRDNKDYWRTTSTYSNLPALSADPQVEFTISDSWSAWTPSLSLEKHFSDRVMGYVSANRGYKAGGFNGRANSAAEISTFNPEYVWTYELGLKSQSANGRLRGNVAAFRSNYRDFQARVSEVQNPGDPVPTFAFPVLNAAELVIDGVEFEGSALLGDSTLLSAQLGWMNARYERFDDPRVDVDPTLAGLHDHVPFSPEFTARLALQHTFQLGGRGSLTLGGDVSYRDDTWLSVDNRPGLMQDAYTLVGLFGVWDSPQYAWQVRAGVRNLTDEVYKIEGQEFSSIGNIQTAYYGMPRNWYLSVRYNF
jgi:iron complex outermembrane receptor protein